MQNARNQSGKFKVYIRKKCDHGPFLDSKKVENLSHHFHSKSVKKTITHLYNSIIDCSLESKKGQLKNKLSFVDNEFVLDRFSKGKAAIVTLKQELQSCNNFIGIRPPKRACCKKCKLAVEEPDQSSANQDLSSSDFDQETKINVKKEAPSTSTTPSLKKEVSFITHEDTTVDNMSSFSKSGRKSTVKIFIRQLCSTGSLLDPEKISKLPDMIKSDNIPNLSKLVLEAIVKCAYDVERVFNMVPYGSGHLTVEAKIGEFLQRRSFPHTHSKKELRKLLEHFSKSVGFCENLLTLNVPSVQNCKMCQTKRKHGDTELAGFSGPNKKRQKLVPSSIECKELKVVISRLPDEVVNRYLKPSTPKTKEVYFLGQKVTVTYTDSKYLKTPEKVLFRDAPPLSHTSPLEDTSNPFLFPVNIDESLPAVLMIDDVNIAPEPIDDPLSALFEKDNEEISTVLDLVNDNEFSESAELCERSLTNYSPKPWDSDLEILTVEESQDSGKSDTCGEGSAASTTMAISESVASKESLVEAMESVTEVALPEVSKHQVNQVDVITKIVTVEKSTEVFIRNRLEDSFSSEYPSGTTSSGESPSCVSSIISQSSSVEKSSGIQDTTSAQDTNQTKKLSHFSTESGTSQNDRHSQGSMLPPSSRDLSNPSTRRPNDLVTAKCISEQGTRPLGVPGKTMVLPSSNPLSGLPVTACNSQYDSTQHPGHEQLTSLPAMNSGVQNIRGSMPLTSPRFAFHGVSPNGNFNQFQAGSPTYPFSQPLNLSMSQSPQSNAFQWGGQRSQPYRPHNTALAQKTFPLSTYVTQSPRFGNARQSQTLIHSQRGAAKGQKISQTQPLQMSMNSTRPLVHPRLMSHGMTGGDMRQSEILQRTQNIQSMARLAHGPKNGVAFGMNAPVSYPQIIPGNKPNRADKEIHNRREGHQRLPLTASSGPTYSLASNTKSSSQLAPHVSGRTVFPLSNSSRPQKLAEGVVWFPSNLTSIPETEHHLLATPYAMQNAHPGYASAANPLSPGSRPVSVVIPQQSSSLTMCITNNRNSVQVNSPRPQCSRTEICNLPGSKNANGSFQVSLQKSAIQTHLSNERHQTTKPVLPFSKCLTGANKASNSPSFIAVTCTVPQQSIQPEANRGFAAHTSQWPGSLSMAKEQFTSLRSFSADVITSTVSPGSCLAKEQSLVQSHTNTTILSTNPSSKPSYLPISERMDRKVNSRDTNPTNLLNCSALDGETIGRLSPNVQKEPESLSKPIKEIETTKPPIEGGELHSISKLLGSSKTQVNKTPNFENGLEKGDGSLTILREQDTSKKERKIIETSSTEGRTAESFLIEPSVEKKTSKSSNEVQKASKSSNSISSFNQGDLSKTQLPKCTGDIKSDMSPIEGERQKSKSFVDKVLKEPPTLVSKENEVSDSSEKVSKNSNSPQSNSVATKENEDVKVENVRKTDLPKAENVNSIIPTYLANSTFEMSYHQHSPPPEKSPNVKSTMGALLSVLSECEYSRKERVKVLLMSLLRKIKTMSTINNDEISVLIGAVGPVTQKSESFKRLMKGLSELSSVHSLAINSQDEKPPQYPENTDALQERVYSQETSQCGNSTNTTDTAPKSISCGNSLEKKSPLSSLTGSVREASGSNVESSRKASNNKNTSEDLIVDPKDTQGDNMTSIIQTITGENSLPEIPSIEAAKRSSSSVITGLGTGKIMATQKGNDATALMTETSQFLDNSINNEKVSSSEILRPIVDVSAHAFLSSLPKNSPSQALHPNTKELENEEEVKPVKMTLMDEGEQCKLSAKSEELPNHSQQLSQVIPVEDRPYTVLEQGREQPQERSSVVDGKVSMQANNSPSSEENLLEGNEINANSVKLSSFEKVFSATNERTDTQYTSVFEKTDEPKHLDQNRNMVSTTRTPLPSQTVQEIVRSENAPKSLSASAVPLHTRFMNILKQFNKKDQKHFNSLLKGILQRIRADRAIALSDLVKLRAAAPFEFRKTKEFKELMNIFRQSLNSDSDHPSSDEIIDLTSEEGEMEVLSDSATEGSSRDSPISSLSEIVSMVHNKVNTRPIETSSGIPTDNGSSLAMSSMVTHTQTQIIHDKVKDESMETIDATKRTEPPPILSSSAYISANNPVRIPEASYSDSTVDISLDVSKNDDVVSQTAYVSASSVVSNELAAVVSSTIPVNVLPDGIVLGARTPLVHGSSFVQITREDTGSSLNTYSVPQSIAGELSGIPVNVRIDSSSLLHSRPPQTVLRSPSTNRPPAAAITNGLPGPSENPPRNPYGLLSDSRNTVTAACQSAATNPNYFINAQPGNYSNTPMLNPQNNKPPFGNIALTNFNPVVTNRPNMYASTQPRNSVKANNKVCLAQSRGSSGSSQVSTPRPSAPPSLATRKNAQLPKPILSISAVPGASVLMWDLQDKSLAYSIVSYEIYAIQLESSETITQDIVSSKIWTPLGVIKSLPLPMAITLNNLREGLRNYVVVRAVDRVGRTGPFSSVCEVKAEHS